MKSQVYVSGVGLTAITANKMVFPGRRTTGAGCTRICGKWLPSPSGSKQSRTAHHRSLCIAGHDYSSPAIGSNGAVYIKGQRTNFFALQASVPLAEPVWPKCRANPQNTRRLQQVP